MTTVASMNASEEPMMHAASVSVRLRSALGSGTARAYCRGMRRGAVAGIVAATVWAAAEPALGRAFGTPYSDVRLLGRVVTRGRLWPVAGLALHAANGAVFGAVFERLGGRGVSRAVAAAELESLLLWPGMAVVDRVHPDRRSGYLPPLLWNGRVFAYEAATHALFGLVLGLLLREDR